MCLIIWKVADVELSKEQLVESSWLTAMVFFK